MNTTPELAVIIPCHNEATTLGDQLDALERQEWDGTWEVVVVDNASTDATAAVAAGHQATLPLRIVSATAGRGVAYARNEGVRSTAARSVAFCDGDDVVGDGWLAAMGDALRSNQCVTGVIDPTLLNPPWLARARAEAGTRRAPRFGPIPFARGNNCGLRRRVLEEVGYYDEEFVGLEDIELSLRVAAADIQIHLAKGAEVAYRYRTDVRSTWRQGFYYGVGRPELARRARRLGLTPPPRFAGLRSWAWLLVHLPRLRHRTGRFAALWVLANRAGVLVGAVRSRTLFI